MLKFYAFSHSLLGGLIARHAGYSWAFTLAGCLNLLQILYIVFFMQTNISPQNGGQSACRGLCTLDSLRELFTFLKVTGANLTARFTIALAALCLTVTWLVSTGEIFFLNFNMHRLVWFRLISFDFVYRYEWGEVSLHKSAQSELGRPGE